MHVKYFCIGIASLPKNAINEELAKLNKIAEDVINISISNNIVYVFYKD